MSRNLFLQLIFPGWMLRWGTPLMRRFYVAQHELQVRTPTPADPRGACSMPYDDAHATHRTSAD